MYKTESSFTQKNINKHLLFKILIVSLQSSNIYHTFSNDNKIVSSSFNK